MSTSCLSSCTDLGVCRVDTVQFLQHNNIFPLFKYIVQEELPPSVMWSALALESLSWSPQALPLLGIGGVSGSFLEKPVTPLRYRDFAVQIQSNPTQMDNMRRRQKWTLQKQSCKGARAGRCHPKKRALAASTQHSKTKVKQGMWSGIQMAFYLQILIHHSCAKIGIMKFWKDGCQQERGDQISIF